MTTYKLGLTGGAAAVALLSLLASPAYAQSETGGAAAPTAEAAQQAQVDELVVVGSRIRRGNLNSA